MENQVEEKNTNMGSVISRSEQFIEKNQKTLIIVVAAIVVVVLAFFGLRKWYFQPREVRAAEEMFAAARKDNAILTWILRLVGFILFFAGRYSPTIHNTQ